MAGRGGPVMLRKLLVVGVLAAVAVPASARFKFSKLDYGPKYHTPTMDVVTPHIAWAKPCERGPLRVLFIAPRTCMREVVEIAQRFEIDYAFLPIYQDCIYDFYVPYPPAGEMRFIKGHHPAEQEKMVKERLGHEYDLIVMSALHWPGAPSFVRYEVLRQVKNGAGLIKSTGSGWGKQTDEFLAKALVKRITVPEELAQGLPWKSLPVFSKYRDASDFLSSTLAASAFGQGKIVLIQGFDVPHLQILAPGFTAKPITHYIRDISRHREKEYPEYSLPVDDIKLLHYDYYLAYVIRVMMYAAGRLPDVVVQDDGAPHILEREDLGNIDITVANNGEARSGLEARLVLRDVENQVHAESDHDLQVLPAGESRISFRTRPLPAGEYFADVWVMKGGKIVSFGTRALRVASGTSLKGVTLDRDSLGTSEGVGGRIEIAAGTPDLSGLSVAVEQIDNFGRVVCRESMRPEQGVIKFALPAVKEPLTVYQTILVSLSQGDMVIDTSRDRVTYNDLYAKGTIQFWASQRPHSSYLSFHVHDLLYKAGFDATTFCIGTDEIRGNYFGTESTFRFGRAEVPVLRNLYHVPAVYYFKDLAGAVAWEGEHQKSRELTAEKGIRFPCLHDPRLRDGIRKRMIRAEKYFGRFSTQYYMIGEECGFRGGPARREWNDHELCFSEETRAFFREYLKEQYGDLASLNEEYGTDYRTFDDVEPIKLEAVKEKPRLAPLWADFRMAMESAYSGIFAYCRQSLRESNPDAKLGTEVTFGHDPNSISAVDLWKASRWADFFQPYEKLFLNKARADFAPAGTLIAMGEFGEFPESWNEPFLRFVCWDQLFNGANLFLNNGCTAFPGFMSSRMSGDYSIYPTQQLYIDSANEIKCGIGKLVHGARHNAPIALLYSVASTHRATIVMGSLQDQAHVMRWVHTGHYGLLKDCGFQFHYVSDQELEEGVLSEEGFRMLILPYAQAISEKGIRNIERFVSSGGLLLADMRPGVSDGHGKPYESSPLDEVFGVRQDTGNPRFAGDFAEVGVGENEQTLNVISARIDTSLVAAGGQAKGTVQGAPVVVMNNYGKGRAALLNMWPATYMIDREGIIAGQRIASRRYEKHAPTWRTFFKKIMKELGVVPRVEFSPRLPNLYAYEFESGDIEYIGITQELPECVTKYTDKTAKPLFCKKTVVSFPRQAHVYDSRAGIYLGHTNTVRLFIQPGDAKLFSLMPYRVNGVAVSAPGRVTPGREIRYEAHVDAEGQAQRHVFHVVLTDPDGKELKHYTRNAETVAGRCGGVIHTALNERPGRYTLTVTDAATGLAGRACIDVLPEAR